MTRLARPRLRHRKLVGIAGLGAAALLVPFAGTALAGPAPHRVPLRHPVGHAHEDGPWGSPPEGTVLYVSTRGSDTGPGTAPSSCEAPDQPCATIAHAVSSAPSGATVLVAAGTYTIDLPPNPSSPGGIELSRPVTLEARGNVVLTGAGPIFSLYNAADPSAGVVGPITISGFQFQNVTGSGYNGVITTPGYGAGNVTIAGNTFSGTTAEAIGYHGNPGLVAPLGTNWQIVGNRVGDVATGANGMFLGDLSDSLIEGNQVSNTGHGGILLTGEATGANTHDQILDNVVTDIPYEGIQVADGNGVLVKGNVVSHAGTSCMAPPTPSGCGGGALSSTTAFMLYNADQTNVTLLDNTASDSYDGLTVGQPPYSGSNLLGTGIAVLENNFTGDTNAGIANFAPAGSAPLDAMLDWWGCRTGPNTAGCSATVGSVEATPWADHPVALPVGPAVPFVGPGFFTSPGRSSSAPR